MSIATTIAAGFAAIRAETADTATYSSTDYTVAASTMEDSKVYSAAGAAMDYDRTIRFLASELAANGHNPQPGEKVTISSEVYRIMRRFDDPFGVVVRIDLGKEY